MLRKAQGRNSGKSTTDTICDEKISEFLKSGTVNDATASILNEALALQSKEESKPKVRPPILVNHGLLSSSADFVLLGPQKALGDY